MAAPDSTIAIAPTIDGVPLKVKLRRAERMRKVKAISLILPLFLFLVVSFVAPIVAMLFISVQSPEMGAALSVILIACALVFFGLYNRLIGIDKLRMG